MSDVTFGIPPRACADSSRKTANPPRVGLIPRFHCGKKLQNKLEKMKHQSIEEGCYQPGQGSSLLWPAWRPDILARSCTAINTVGLANVC
ncbi:hypothetical protein Y032_0043g808 [Ancylostoma ceylanicum]|uniref:Uncharacterized protein n=1 Tax=Ancylostoma ceylanicum TaxID=53326 RepID=A0A016UE73_9BILA|nr:hypothetical protein Y032_0043g808 [Ancylostoma ceylanicum]